jgi:hypothetical protein
MRHSKSSARWAVFFALILIRVSACPACLMVARGDRERIFLNDLKDCGQFNLHNCKASASRLAEALQ